MAGTAFAYAIPTPPKGGDGTTKTAATKLAGQLAGKNGTTLAKKGSISHDVTVPKGTTVTVTIFEVVNGKTIVIGTGTATKSGLLKITFSKAGKAFLKAHPTTTLSVSATESKGKGKKKHTTTSTSTVKI